MEGQEVLMVIISLAKRFSEKAFTNDSHSYRIQSPTSEKGLWGNDFHPGCLVGKGRQNQYLSSLYFETWLNKPLGGVLCVCKSAFFLDCLLEVQTKPGLEMELLLQAFILFNRPRNLQVGYFIHLG